MLAERPVPVGTGPQCQRDAGQGGKHPPLGGRKVFQSRGRQGGAELGREGWKEGSGLEVGCQQRLLPNPMPPLDP